MRRVLFVLPLLTASACAALPEESAVSIGPVSSATKPVVVDAPEPLAPTDRRPEPSFGLRARVPVTGESVDGVRLVSHKVRTLVRGGFARTTVEEVWANDTGRVLEGALAFNLPSKAAVSRLALDVDGKIVEGEIEEKRRAKQIFRAVTDYVPVPKDPALLDVAGARGELRIYPMPAHGTRRVIVAYDEVLSATEGGGRYVLPLTLGEGRGTAVGDLDVEVRVEGAGTVRADTATEIEGGVARLRGRDVSPSRDFVVRWDGASPRFSRLAPEPGTWGETAARAPAPFVGVRLAVPPSDAVFAGPVVLAVDRAHGAPERAARLADATLRAMPDAPFVLLACDAVCEAFPKEGLAAPADRARAVEWMSKQTVGGAFDLAGASVAAMRRAGPGGRAVVLSRGAPSAGELSPDAIAGRVRAAGAGDVELRYVAVGAEADVPFLGALAGKLSAVLVEDRGEPELAAGKRLALPALRGAKLELPEGLSLAHPSAPPSLLAGDELLVTARAEGVTRGEARLRGELDGKPVEASVSLEGEPVDAPLLATAWARGRIATLEAQGDAMLAPQIVKLSRDFHVPSRLTSMIVLENEAMFAAFGVTRTSRRLDDFGPAGGTAPVAVGAASAASGDATSAKGNMWGSGESFGAGGLGLTGVGAGGGGGTIGHGAGIAQGLGRLSGEHVTRAPVVRMGGASVSGRLPPEVIQRIVRTQFGRFRLCLENGMRENPEAGGRITVRFVIGRDGAVAAAQIASSTLSPASMGACVVGAFRRLSFPSPEGGPVTVTFPLQLAPGGTAEPHTVLRPVPTETIALPGSDAWKTGGDADLGRLAAARDEHLRSRAAHETLVAALVRRGRVADALAAAALWAKTDRDEAKAHERLAETSALAGDAKGALRALASAVATSPASLGLQRRAARAHALQGDAARACAFSRAAASLPDAKVEDKVEALRCRAELGDQSAADEAAVLAEKSAVARKLAAGEAVQADAGSEGTFSAEVTCADACPAIAFVTPQGRVVSAATPLAVRASATRVDLPYAGAGTYRVVWLGTPPTTAAEITLRTPSGPRKLKSVPGVETVCSVEVPDVSGFGWGR